MVHGTLFISRHYIFHVKYHIPTEDKSHYNPIFYNNHLDYYYLQKDFSTPTTPVDFLFETTNENRRIPVAS